MFTHCTDCGKKLSKAVIEEIIELCGADAEEAWWSCKNCTAKAHKDLLDDLSEARYGESGHYSSFNDIDVDDFPGFKG